MARTSPVESADPVAWYTSHGKATSASLSPNCETNCPAHNKRKLRLPNSDVSTAVASMVVPLSELATQKGSEQPLALSERGESNLGAARRRQVHRSWQQAFPPAFSTARPGDSPTAQSIQVAKTEVLSVLAKSSGILHRFGHSRPRRLTARD